MKENTIRPVRVLIVDDSALVRKVLADGFAGDGGIEVVGQAGNPYQARDLLVELKPDVITLDVEMPRMDGVTFLRHFMPIMPTPTVMISSLTKSGKKITLDALEAGAVDIVAKPTVGLVDGLPAMLDEICRRVKAAAFVDVSRFARSTPLPIEHVSALDETTDQLIAIGASTGGVQALNRIMPAFPAENAAIVIVQHMPAGVTSSFAERLNGISAMRVREAAHGDRLMNGLALVAPGGQRHMTVIRSGGEYRVALQDGPEVNYSRPAVDVLFSSVAKAAGRNAAAAVLTGMGRDGAAGLLAIRNAGGRTMVQDEATSIVYGMPKAANDVGGAEVVAPLEKIPALLARATRRG
ncbi:chemotaxis response regulator protein-glutamate methylesterase [Methylocystis sp. WRRC1]|uniref:protein-glutamate methylesterase/protein-glutamine glutaminase n=1 Tax=Methylocystis sp. WRRC1 TaxID=1732014 RepID=UPI001D14E479|nr:chemotaxis response regulator protein-glutamate methylesterase [Methylocystis sp. WRRC1]MCC3247424.1 chemotaxis response regulator protein-glutamate methylesterase [Methylocystis sp. WRRC1]